MVSNARMIFALSALFLAVPACNGGPTAVGDPNNLSAVVATPSLALGAAIPVVFHNRSATEVSVGPLGCSAALERHLPESDKWQRLESLRSCIQIVTRVAAGADLAFEVPSPDATGSYRVLFGVHPVGSADVDVRSNTFEVE